MLPQYPSPARTASVPVLHTAPNGHPKHLPPSFTTTVALALACMPGGPLALIAEAKAFASFAIEPSAYSTPSTVTL